MFNFIFFVTVLMIFAVAYFVARDVSETWARLLALFFVFEVFAFIVTRVFVSIGKRL
jgi:hypothetical protein